MPEFRFSESAARGRRPRWGTVAIVLALHLVAAVALVKGLAAAGVIEDPIPMTAVYDVPLPPPSPSPTPSETQDAGKAAPEAATARAKQVAAPKPKEVIRPKPAPSVAGKGDESRAGAGTAGAGSGAGGIGTGSGSGAGGTGLGGGMAGPAVKTAGDINSIRDYPKAGRDARLGHSAGIEMTVGTDGRAHGCRIIQSSGDPVSDQITCRLAEQRFRFRPRTNSLGLPVESTFRWYQRFFVP